MHSFTYANSKGLFFLIKKIRVTNKRKKLAFSIGAGRMKRTWILCLDVLESLLTLYYNPNCFESMVVTHTHPKKIKIMNIYFLLLTYPWIYDTLAPYLCNARVIGGGRKNVEVSLSPTFSVL